MRAFDPTQPLIFIHVPKTAGTSVERIIRAWFPGAFHPHYYNEKAGSFPSRLDLRAPMHIAKPPVIYGHFNQERGFGVEDYYPQIHQCLCILRDPLDMQVSTYYYIRRTPHHPQHDALSTLSLDQFIQNDRPNMLQHFPRRMSLDNHRDIIEEFFIDIGCMETLEASMTRIGQRLSKPTGNLEIPHLNVSEREDVDWARYGDMFRDRWPLEHAVYDHARAMAPAPDEPTPQAS